MAFVSQSHLLRMWACMCLVTAVCWGLALYCGPATGPSILTYLFILFFIFCHIRGLCFSSRAIAFSTCFCLSVVVFCIVFVYVVFLFVSLLIYICLFCFCLFYFSFSVLCVWLFVCLFVVSTWGYLFRWISFFGCWWCLCAVVCR